MNNRALEKKDWLFLKDSDRIPEAYKEGQESGIKYLQTGKMGKNPYPKNTLGWYSFTRGHNDMIDV